MRASRRSSIGRPCQEQRPCRLPETGAGRIERTTCCQTRAMRFTGVFLSQRQSIAKTLREQLVAGLPADGGEGRVGLDLIAPERMPALGRQLFQTAAQAIQRPRFTLPL